MTNTIDFNTRKKNKICSILNKVLTTTKEIIHRSHTTRVITNNLISTKLLKTKTFRISEVVKDKPKVVWAEVEAEEEGEVSTPLLLQTHLLTMPRSKTSTKGLIVRQVSTVELQGIVGQDNTRLPITSK